MLQCVKPLPEPMTTFWQRALYNSQWDLNGNGELSFSGDEFQNVVCYISLTVDSSDIRRSYTKYAFCLNHSITIENFSGLRI